MKRILYLLVIGFVTFSCQEQSIKSINKDNIAYIDSWPTIENSTDHYDFIKFIIENPESDNFDTALYKHLYYRDKMWDTIPPPPCDCFRNCISIEVNKKGEILLDGRRFNKDSLRISLLNFLINKEEKHDMPLKMEITDFNNTKRLISRGRFEVSYYNVSYDTLQNIVIEIGGAINNYKSYLSNDWYSKDYSYLDSINKKFLDSYFDCRIIFWDFEEIHNFPPPPPLDSSILNIEYEV